MMVSGQMPKRSAISVSKSPSWIVYVITSVRGSSVAMTTSGTSVGVVVAVGGMLVSFFDERCCLMVMRGCGDIWRFAQVIFWLAKPNAKQYTSHQQKANNCQEHRFFVERFFSCFSF